MPEIQEEGTEEVIINETPVDEKGEEGQDEKGPEEGGEDFDESQIDPEVRDYKPATTPEDEEDEIDPDDKARIEKVMEKKFGSEFQSMKQKIETDAFFNANPEYSKYRGAAEKYKAHPDFAKLSMNNIVAIVASKDQQKIGAAKERAAAARVAETKSPGSSFRKPSGESFDWRTASKEEFAAQKAKVLGRPSIN